MTTGERVRLLRTARGMNQAQLASAAGVEAATLSNIEAGHREPRASTREVLAEALRVSSAGLVDDAQCIRDLMEIVGVSYVSIASLEGNERRVEAERPREELREIRDRLVRLETMIEGLFPGGRKK